MPTRHPLSHAGKALPQRIELALEIALLGIPSPLLPLHRIQAALSRAGGIPEAQGQRHPTRGDGGLGQLREKRQRGRMCSWEQPGRIGIC